MLHPSEIPPVVIVSTEAENLLSPSGKTKIRLNDGEDARLGHELQQPRRYRLNTAKRQRLGIALMPCELRFGCGVAVRRPPADELRTLIEEKIARTAPIPNGENRE